jgi:hypothetical protein
MPWDTSELPDPYPSKEPKPLEKSRCQADLLFEYGKTAGKTITTEIRNVYALGQHLSNVIESKGESPFSPAEMKEIDGIPTFFTGLSTEDKAIYCFDYVANSLSAQFKPVSFESLFATKRKIVNDPWSSYAARFTLRMYWYALVIITHFAFFHYCLTIETGALEDINEFLLAALKYINDLKVEISAILFGCVGALAHLLNHVITANKERTYELHESRLILSRIILGGIVGAFVSLSLRGFIPGVGDEGEVNGTEVVPQKTLGTNGIAFLAGYSVKYSIGLIERTIRALFPSKDT